MPLAEHDALISAHISGDAVSIHVPLAEHDRQGSSLASPKLTFQFTCPSRSTTGPLQRVQVLVYVSIHVPLAEHD